MRDDRSTANRIFTGLLILLAAWAAWTAAQWRYEVRFAPLATSVAFGGLALAQLLRAELPALRARRAARVAATVPQEERIPVPAGGAPVAEMAETQEPEKEEESQLDLWKGAGWCFACLLLVILLGILLGLPIAVFVLCKLAFRTGWLVSLGTVVATIGILWIFDTVFNVFWPVGLAFSWLYT